MFLQEKIFPVGNVTFVMMCWYLAMPYSGACLESKCYHC